MSNLESFYSETLELSSKELHHLVNVKRYQIGDQIFITNGKGVEKQVEITNLNPFQINSIKTKTYNYPELEITLVLALIKGQRFDNAVESAVEIGVNEIILWKADRSIASFDKKFDKEQIKINNLIISSSKQSRRVWFPKCQNYFNTKNLVSFLEASGFSQILLAYENSNHLIEDIAIPPSGKIALIIGPEGGISENEVQQFRQIGALECQISKNILRTATACVVGLTKIIR